MSELRAYATLCSNQKHSKTDQKLKYKKALNNLIIEYSLAYGASIETIISTTSLFFLESDFNKSNLSLTVWNRLCLQFAMKN